MKYLHLLILVFVYCTTAYCQKKKLPGIDYSLVDNMALSIPDSLTHNTGQIAAFFDSVFPSDSNKVRAAFIWVASGINYDVENMFALNLNESQEDIISRTILTRTAKCQGYAALFREICMNMNIMTHIVYGYTKQNDFVDYFTHAWCATFIDSTWYLIDPTWGSGHLNKGKFVRKINNFYFKPSPHDLVKTHMPFDYMWQLLNYPVNTQKFYAGNFIPDTSTPFFNYNDTINAYEQLDTIAKLESATSRLEKNGIKNSVTYDWLKRNKLNIEYYSEQRKINLYNRAIDDYNTGVELLNKFIEYRNAMFKPARPDMEIKQMLDQADSSLTNSKSVAALIDFTSEYNRKSIVKFIESVVDVEKHLNEQEKWLTEYLSKNRSGRRSMFVKYTWFGIPLN